MNPDPAAPAIPPNPTYGYLADGLVALHFAFMAFIAFGQLAIILAALLNQLGVKGQWGRNPWFRFTHLGCILYVVYEAIMGIRCPLTEWQEQWRMKAGQEMSQSSTFIGRYAHDYLFWDDVISYQAIKVMTICFGIIVVQGIIMYPPRWFRRKTAVLTTP